MDIEKIKMRLVQHPHYSRLQNNIHTFDSYQTGGSMIIFDPYNLDKEILIQRNSEEVQKYRERTELGIKEYQEKINQLSQEKLRLQKKIF